MRFADRLETSIKTTGSCLIAGCDPVLEKLPAWIHQAAESRAVSDDDYLSRVLGSFADIFLAAVEKRVAAIKPNIAFFEQYGLPGITEFHRLCRAIRQKSIPLVIDAKRGDIGTTAAAYSTAFLGRISVRGREHEVFYGDAVTVNPFLGFDTLEPFLLDCARYGKGIFVLVQTSNPGSKDIQGLPVGSETLSAHVARWLADRCESLAGQCGWSGLGAVVGATYPEEARSLRAILPTSYFLIPGFGTQGGAASDAVAGFGMQNGKRGGAIVNVSRALLEGNSTDEDSFIECIRANVNKFNSSLTEALID